MKTTGKQLTLDELMRSPTIKRVPQMVLFEPAICHIMGWKPREKVTKPELPTEQKAFLEMHGKDENTLRNIILRTKDPDEKQAALNRLGEMLDQLIDPFSFCIIAAYAEDPKIRKAAFERITTEDNFSRVRRWSNFEDTKKAAFNKLVEMLEQLTDPFSFCIIAADAEDPNIRKAAFERITTEEDFSRVRRWSNFEDTKLAAAKKLERLKKQKETPAPQTKEELLEEIARNSAGYHYDHISAGMNMGQVLGTYYGHDVSSVIREQLDKINRYWSSEPLKDEIVNAFHSISPKSPFVKNLFFKKNDDFTSFGFVTFESKGKRTPTGHLHYFFISVMMPNKSADLLFDLITIVVILAESL